MASLRIGVVGSRFAAHLHLAAYRHAYGVDARLTGVTSPTAERREAFARETGTTPYASLAAMLPHVDVVDVCAPPAHHEPVALEAIEAGKHVFVEKPFTGAFGPPGAGAFAGNRASKEALLEDALASAGRIVGAARRRGVVLAYAENWIYAPAIQKEREIIEKTDAQILWMLGGESHSGSHSPVYGIWRHAGGGSLVGKGCHPLSACLYLKQVEGRARRRRPIRPATVSCRVHEITRLPGFQDRGFLRTDYEDIEDYGQLHVTFDDGTVADVYATELVLGGVHNWLEVFANNHRTMCRLNPVNLLDTYNPAAAQFRDVYVVEKIGTKEGWSHPAADEEWQQGFYGEIQDFLECCASGRTPQSGATIAHDTVATLYAGYVSAERQGQEVAVPVAPLSELESG
ncbi:MAG TPA: Gfo/Idh/MocA family oxidoreductase [Candidatus Acidoferrum sp.]|nr:Gfo/Idh/MocA family oxidoreductase [Candidatus Acidoferrum sp.]